MELCTGGELIDNKCKDKYQFTDQKAANIFKQLLGALNHIHSQNLIHRDIKPENFLFESKAKDSDVKIIDFGLSKILKSTTEPVLGKLSIFGIGKGKTKETLERMDEKAGTPQYVSPEVLAGNYGIDCDMWSAGCILYVLLCGYTPFHGEDDYELCRNVLRG